MCYIWSSLLSTDLCIAVSDNQWSCDHSQIEAVVLSAPTGWQDHEPLYLNACSSVIDLKMITACAVASLSVGKYITVCLGSSFVMLL